MAGILRAPRWLFRVDDHKMLVELPSFVRGLVGLYVFIGVVVVTAYQCNNFAVNQFGESSTLQPGSTFTDGASTGTALTFLTASVSFIGSGITCDSSYVATATLGSSSLTTICTTAGANTTFMISMPGPQVLPSTQASFQLVLTGFGGNLVFSPVLQYTFTAHQFNNNNITISETIVGSSTSVVTGLTTVNLAAVPVEQLDINDKTTGTGFDVSYINTSPGLSSAPSTSLTISFDLVVPQYYLQILQTQEISALAFISGLLAIGGGVIAGGNLIAFALSFLAHHVLHKGAGHSTASSDIELTKQNPSWI